MMTIIQIILKLMPKSLYLFILSFIALFKFNGKDIKIDFKKLTIDIKSKNKEEHKKED